MMKADYNLSFNIKRVFDIMSKNLTNFIRNDFKFLLIPFLSLFLIFNGLISLIVAGISGPIVSPLTSFVVLIIGLILFLYSMYIFQWLSATKSYHTLQEYMDNKNSYSNNLENTKDYKLRPFLGSIISSLIVFVIVFVIYGAFVFLLFGVSRFSSVNPVSIFLSLAQISSILPLPSKIK